MQAGAHCPGRARSPSPLLLPPHGRGRRRSMGQNEWKAGSGAKALARPSGAGCGSLGPAVLPQSLRT
eukprot:scaffold704_cov347-Prasinococcus_capsulatus_cf.AAC.38